MEPIMDLSHFSLPDWAHDMGGWESDKVVEAFVSFAEMMVSEFRDEVKYWATFNEPDTYTTMVHMPWPIPKKNAWLDYPRGWGHFDTARKNMVRAHNLAYQAMKEKEPDAQVGFTVSMAHYDGWRDPVSNGLRKAMKAKTNDYFAPRMADNADWVGLQSYMHARVKLLRPFANEFKQRSDQGWELYPEIHYHLLKGLSEEVTARRNIPIFITESGLADQEDLKRAKYIRDSVKWMDKAIAEGVDCRTFCYWSLTDNFEWDRGRRPRYGLIAIIYEDGLKRVLRPSAEDYAQIIREHKAAA
jgi:beta-glucosidase